MYKKLWVKSSTKANTDLLNGDIKPNIFNKTSTSKLLFSIRSSVEIKLNWSVISVIMCNGWKTVVVLLVVVVSDRIFSVLVPLFSGSAC